MGSQDARGCGETWGEDRFRALVESSVDWIWEVDADFRYTYVGPQVNTVLGYEPAEVLGKTPFDLMPLDEALRFEAEIRPLVAARSVLRGIEHVKKARDGRLVPLEVSAVPFLGEKGEFAGYRGIVRDIAERKRLEEVTRKSQEIIQRQAREILEVSVPVVSLWEGMVLVPLIGTLDSQRTEQLVERLLARIVETGSAVAVVDITGVGTIDTQTARHLLETFAAVRLLGAQVVLTGVRPAIAQTLVHLDIDLSGVTTRSTLAAGLRHGLDLLDLRVAPKE